MPTYQYTCTECATPIEAVQSFSDPALTVCPTCGGRLRKVFSAVGVVFKGSGFYRNDSRPNGKAAAGAAAESEKSPSADASVSGSKTTDTSATNGSGPSDAPATPDKKPATAPVSQPTGQGAKAPARSGRAPASPSKPAGSSGPAGA